MALHPSLTLPELTEADAWSIVGEPVEAVFALGQGTRSRVYRVVLREGGTRVIKILPRDAQRVAREQWVRAKMAGVQQAPTVPEVLVRQHRWVDHYDVTVMRLIAGQSLSQSLRGAAPQVAARLWHQVGAGLACFHAVTVSGFGLVDGAGRGPFPSWRMAIEHHARALLAEARGTALVDLCDAVEASIARRLGCLDEVRTARLIHGDAHPNNIHVLNDRVTAWLDFEYAMGADPLYELTYLAEGFSPSAGVAQARDQEAFAEGYTARSEALDDAPERTALYRLLHALRGAEYLKVVGPGLDAEARERLTKSMRAKLEARQRG
jgi:Ser/Thr protein kinase RdoA (MazF antagonist)